MLPRIKFKIECLVFILKKKKHFNYNKEGVFNKKKNISLLYTIERKIK